MLTKEEIAKFEELARKSPAIHPEDLANEVKAEQELLDELNEGQGDLSEDELSSALSEAVKAKKLSKILSSSK